MAHLSYVKGSTQALAKKYQIAQREARISPKGAILLRKAVLTMRQFFLKSVLITVIALCVCMAGTLLGTFSPTGFAQAASVGSAYRVNNPRPSGHGVVVPNVSCSGNGCTGLDPIQTGCSASASTILSTGIFSDSGNQIGTVNLRFSSVCQTNWAQVVSSIGTVPMETAVLRASGADGPSIDECEPTDCNNLLATIDTTDAFTNMVWAPDVPTEADGQIQIDNFFFSACVTQDPNALPCTNG